MKRILTNNAPLEPTIFAKDLPVCPIIGTRPRQGLQVKGFIQRIEPRDDQSHQITLTNHIIVGNRYNPSLFGGSLAKALSHPDLEYYLFDTEKELFQWLAQ